MARRKTWTAKRSLALFETHGGICHICGMKIYAGEAWEREHIIPLAMGGADDESNVAPAHKSCHRTKTGTDAAQIAKANRVRAKHFGAKNARRVVIPGSRDSKFKRKLNGQTVLRDSE
ncbi:HNH endonuclease signature motif containing protein [Paracoccus onubensis]|uniref:HNH endonuclease n=1 Tax=Paracoccus onubensis TaxID=1675788 RepID=UPI00272FC8C9|nr:HNH endonuclease signature motif containing protein [Paracoccus onubensis]MDP0928517.1 HNH endonuclease signature motif containing protein [Paracoccus onubensis]